MDVSVKYVDPVKGLLWGNSKQSTGSVSNLAAELGSALVLLSMSAEGCKARVLEDAESDKETLNLEDPLGVKCGFNSEFAKNEDSSKSKSTASDANASGGEKISDIALDGKSLYESSNPPSAKNMNEFSTPSKLVSAMKGGRETRGIHVEKLSVSWAADVYDPPATSLSHTVTNHKQHSSTTSKNYSRNKNKQKAKSSRKSNNGKKNSSKISRNSSKVASY